MEKTLDQYQIIEFEFSSGLQSYLKHYNLLERNVGLCISWLVNHNDPSAAYPFLDKLTAKSKMDVLKELIYYKNSETNEEIIRDFKEWFKLASETRVARNRYVHGYWEVSPWVQNKPIRFNPTIWTSGVGKRKTKDHSQQEMSLKEFQMIVQEMKDVFEEFMQLRKKYDI